MMSTSEEALPARQHPEMTEWRALAIDLNAELPEKMR